MDRNYWDTIAQDYDGEIFDVRANDKNKVIEKRISRLSQGCGKAVDFGCGTGKFLPFLARHFSEVQGYDLSKQLVAQAARTCGGLPQVRVQTRDLAARVGVGARGDFGLCVNVLITDSHAIRSAILAGICRHLKKGAPFLLVVPALESALLTAYRLIDWNRRGGMSSRQASKTPWNFSRIAEGILEIDGVPTKHYVKEELEHWLPQLGFKVKTFHKVEYGWSSEFENPARHLKGPYPWDWLVESEKT